MAEETLGQAEAQGFAYRDWLAAAETGDVRSIRKLLAFEGDAGGAYLHCFVLSALLSKVGDATFAEACREIRDHSGLKDCIAEAFIMGKVPGDWETRFPQTAQALQAQTD